MNENINLCELLKDCTINTVFYSPIIGDCKLSNVNRYDVVVANQKGFLHINPDATATINGCKTVELMLLPSRTQRDWNKWQCPKPKFDPKTLQPFDKVLAKCYPDKKWEAGFFSHPLVLHEVQGFVVNSDFRTYVIPYNDDTKHLVGTENDAPEYYRYWEIEV